jgi:hypothetical protein
LKAKYINLKVFGVQGNQRTETKIINKTQGYRKDQPRAEFLEGKHLLLRSSDKYVNKCKK